MEKETDQLELPLILVTALKAYNFSGKPVWRIGEGLEHVKVELTYKLPTTHSQSSVEQKESFNVNSKEKPPVMSKRGKAKRKSKLAPSNLPAEQPATRHQPERACKTPQRPPPPSPEKQPTPPPEKQPTPPPTKQTTPPPPAKQPTPPPPKKQPPAPTKKQPPPPTKSTSGTAAPQPKSILKKPTEQQKLWPTVNSQGKDINHYLLKGYKIKKTVYGKPPPQRSSDILLYSELIHPTDVDPHYLHWRQHHDNKPTIYLLKNPDSKYYLHEDYNKLKTYVNSAPAVSDIEFKGICEDVYASQPIHRIQPATRP